MNGLGKDIEGNTATNISLYTGRLMGSSLKMMSWSIILMKRREIHHLNEKKRDNRPENLQLKKRSGHARDHGLEQGITMADLICPNCGIKFAKQKRMTHLVGRSKLTFCSRKCIGEFNFPKANKEKIKSAIKGNTQGTRKDYSIGQ